MSYFITYKRAKKWADSYGYNYDYCIKKDYRGLFFVIWDYREPYGV